MALSYCWGPPHISVTQLKTTSKNLNFMKEEVAEALTPKSLFKAVRVCKALNIQYLWVDAVCIIQDSKEDWELESTQMGQVYQHAILTACTWSSTSCQESFLTRQRRLVDIAFQCRLVPDIRGSFGLVYVLNK